MAAYKENKAKKKKTSGTVNTQKNSNIEERTIKAIEKFQYDFLTSTSHQLRTPMATIQSSLDLLEMYIVKDNKVRQVQTIEKIKNTLSVLKDTLESITTLYKHEIINQKLNLSQVEIRKFLNELLNEIIVYTGSSHLINVSIESTQKNIFVDEIILKQILINLLHNAIKFSPEGGQILLFLKSLNNHVEISVKDEGIGIDKREIAKIFSPFFRAKNAEAFPGVGLGLAIVKNLAAIHGAKIRCISAPNLGTEFKISIPQ